MHENVRLCVEVGFQILGLGRSCKGLGLVLAETAETMESMELHTKMG